MVRGLQGRSTLHLIVDEKIIRLQPTGPGYGSHLAAKSAPDGFIFLCNSGSGVSIVPCITPKMTFDHDRNIDPVATGARLQFPLVVRSNAPCKTFWGAMWTTCSIPAWPFRTFVRGVCDCWL